MMAMDEKRKSAEYRLALGASVHIGSQEYSILAFDDEKVSLFNPRFPLISEEMPREQFIQRLRENPMNDGLIDDGTETIDELPAESASELAADAPVEQEQPESNENSVEEQEVNPPSDTIHVGDTVEHDGRTYIIERIGELSHDVSMRDTAFEGSTGVPINRVEKVETVLRWLEESERDLTPAWERTKPEASPIVHSPTGEKHDFRITDMELGYGGLKTKFRMNIEAIKLLKQLDETERLATPEEQEVLSKYVGWGALPMAFDERNEQWKSEYAELKELLTDEEYTAARASTLNAHYTSPTVIQAIYSALDSFGFRMGNILEPSCGVGNFFGMLPEEMRGSKLYGVELDPLTGRIAKQLYQNAKIAIQGFEETNLPDSFFDVAIGNVPFGDYSVSDKKYDKEHFLIHDYFIAKSLDKVRPGGIVAFVTSSGTLEKKNPAARQYIAKRAELIGAIRLPNNAFRANAGTDVVADILFLQKRDHPIEIDEDWL
ncbi:MAG: N-6 DNA methylase, partial [Clostridia bacterium]|nr:N-6 DNA methylase [Clostridia bacterium]